MENLRRLSHQHLLEKLDDALNMTCLHHITSLRFVQTCPSNATHQTLRLVTAERKTVQLDCYLGHLWMVGNHHCLALSANSVTGVPPHNRLYLTTGVNSALPFV